MRVDQVPILEQATVRSGTPREMPQTLSLVVGLAAVVFSALYFISDLIEVAQDGFSTAQLTLTLVAEAAIPFFVVGLYLLQRPRIGRLGLTGTILYAYTFVFFTGTVVYALVNSTSNWDALVNRLGAWMTLHGVLMVVAGVILGVSVARAGVSPAGPDGHWRPESFSSLPQPGFRHSPRQHRPGSAISRSPPWVHRCW